MAIEKKIAQLRSWGFIVGERDERLNRAFRGKFMVVEAHDESELPTDDGSNGPWCIVGDNLNALVVQAFDCWIDDYEPATVAR